MSHKNNHTTLKQLALLFLKLGTVAFGGPAAHIAMMREEVVGRLKWMEDKEFLDLLGATNLIPGPNSTELAIHLGHRMGGWRGLIVAGSSFIFPAFTIVLGFAWLYKEFGTLPKIDSILYGIKPVIVAVIMGALFKLAKAALKSRLLVIMGVLATAALVFGQNELVVLFSVGLVVLLLKEGKNILKSVLPGSMLGVAVIPTAGAVASSIPFSLSTLFLFFLKVGSVLFGSGYVLLAFLRTDLVERLGWMTEAQLLDAVAVGQVTPGPVFTTATFIGYLLGSFEGAVLATIGIFLPAFVFVAISAPFLQKLRDSKTASAFLDGLNAASFALMAVVTFYLGKATFVDVPTVLIAAVSLGILQFSRVQSTWLIVSGGIAGFLLKMI